MLEDINSLPGAQRKIAFIHRDGQAGVSQHGADVRSRIVGAFQIVSVPTVPFGDEALHKRLQICAGGWVPVFADDKRCAGML